jgi:hypothetical protein
VSPDALFARVKEELKSYFDSGVVDDLMFPIWTNKCLQKLSKATLPITQTLLFMDNYEAKLPPDFISVRECWLTASGFPLEYRVPGSYYQQITTQLNRPYDACNPLVNCDPCNPDIITVVAKTNTYVTNNIRLSYLLKPGSIITRNDHCDNLPEMGCLNYSSTSADTFDVRDGKLFTNFRSGDVFLMYYSMQSDNEGNQLIPENYRIQEFIEAFLKQKVFEQVFNQVSDESFNQSRTKYEMYKQMADEAYIIANTEVIKKTLYDRVYAIRRDEHRFDKYERQMYGNSRRWRGGGWPASSWGLND